MINAEFRVTCGGILDYIFLFPLVHHHPHAWIGSVTSPQIFIFSNQSKAYVNCNICNIFLKSQVKILPLTTHSDFLAFTNNSEDNATAIAVASCHTLNNGGFTILDSYLLPALLISCHLTQAGGVSMRFRWEGGCCSGAGVFCHAEE